MREKIRDRNVSKTESWPQVSAQQENADRPFDPLSHNAIVGRETLAPKDGNDAASKLLLLQEEFSAIESGYRRSKQKALLRVYAIAVYLRDDKKAWHGLCKRPEWKDYAKPPSPKNRNLALRYALRLAIGFSAAGTKDVSRYFLILWPYFERKESVQRVEEMIDKAGGLIALGKRRGQRTEEPVTATDDDREDSSSDHRKRGGFAQACVFNPLAKEGDKTANVQRLLKETADFHKRNVVIPHRLTRKATAVNCIRMLTIAVWLARDRDAWDEFCRSKEWIKRKRKPHLDRPEEAFHFVVLSLSRRVRLSLNADPLYVSAKVLWREIFKRISRQRMLVA